MNFNFPTVPYANYNFAKKPDATISFLLQQLAAGLIEIKLPSTDSVNLNNLIFPSNPFFSPNSISNTLLVPNGLPISTNPTPTLFPTQLIGSPSTTLNTPNVLTALTGNSNRTTITPTIPSENGSSGSSRKYNRSRERKYDKHIKKFDGGLMCKFCERQYKTYKAAADHVTRYHLRPYLKCHLCDYKTQTHSPFHTHLYIRHGIPIPKNSSVYKKQCLECPHVAKNEDCLKNHVSKKHDFESNAWRVAYQNINNNAPSNSLISTTVGPESNIIFS